MLNYSIFLELLNQNSPEYKKYLMNPHHTDIENPHQLQMILKHSNTNFIGDEISDKIISYERSLQNLKDLVLHVCLLSSKELDEVLYLMIRISNGLIILLEEIFPTLSDKKFVHYAIKECINLHGKLKNDVLNNLTGSTAQKIKQIFIINCRAIKIITSFHRRCPEKEISDLKKKDKDEGTERKSSSSLNSRL